MIKSHNALMCKL